MTKVVVIGAGVGGLTAAASLARSGVDVTVLEAHVYAGGCAGTFFHQGYRFDAGATLAAGFYPGGPMDLVCRATGITGWPSRAATRAMVVHLPDGVEITRRADDTRWQERIRRFGPESERFWRWQEATADALWDLALRLPPWPPQNLWDANQLLQEGLAWSAKNLRSHPQLLIDAFRTAAVRLRDAPERLRLFVDAQLLISAQTTSDRANALYAASALDLPRRGVVHLEGGMGAVSDALVHATRRNGGQVHFRQEVRRIIREQNRITGVETKRGDFAPADLIIANLTPWNLAALIEGAAPKRLRRLPDTPRGWGAFMLYVGLDASVVPHDFALHHQVVVREPLGEGNIAFLSLSPAWDQGRAPTGKRALTISTHSTLAPWWQLFEGDRPGYEARKRMYTQQLLEAAETALPGFREAAELVLPGTPVTFQRFTRRRSGWVGGFPQTSLFRAWGPRLGPELWMVGDSIFPGQSTAAVALGGLRVANAILSRSQVAGRDLVTESETQPTNEIDGRVAF
jgi:C-3',4' desaturase CrtD